MVSVLILTKNEEKMIVGCLESAKWADEIVILDNDSSDKTIEIAEKFTDKIFSKKFESYEEERNFLAEKANGDWIFYLDADERISLHLREEIEEITTNKRREIGVFAVPRKNILLGKWQKFGGWWPDYQIRLFKRDCLRGWHGKLHERPEFEGELSHLKNPLIHLTHRDIASMMEKTAEWSKIEAKLRLDASHPKISGWRLLRVVMTEFFERLVKKQGFREGTEGWLEAIFQSFSMFITYFRLWEIQRKDDLAKTYKKIDEKLKETNFEDVGF